MTTTSYPAVGTGGFSPFRWGEYFESDWGIINDYAGTAAALTRIAAGDIARYSIGYIRVGGYVLKISADHDLPVPTAAGTYYTWACYDPALNVAGGGGAATADGPCRLGISSGLPSTTGNKKYVFLDMIERSASQALTAAVVTSLRVWTGPSVSIKQLPSGAAGAEWFVQSANYSYPIGSTLHVRDINVTYHRDMDGPNLIWRADAGPEVAFPAPNSLVAFDSPAVMSRESGRVFLGGTLRRSSNAALSNGSEVLLGTLPELWRPGRVRRFHCFGNGAGSAEVLAPVKVGSNGSVIMYDPPATVTWIDLSAINFKIGA